MWFLLCFSSFFQFLWSSSVADPDSGFRVKSATLLYRSCLHRIEDHFSWSVSSKMWRLLFMICFWQNVKITFHDLFLAKCEDHFSWSDSSKMWRTLFMIWFWQNVKITFHYLFLAKCEDHFSWSVSGKMWRSLFMIWSSKMWRTLFMICF